MKSICGLLFVTTVFCVAVSFAQFQPQNTPGAEMPQGHRWDAAHGVLFLGRRWLLQKIAPPLRAYNEDGTRYGADIKLFEDFPNLQKAGVDDFAAGPAGTTLMATDLIYGPNVVSYQILTYDSAGNLHSFFNINDVEAMTTDDRGDIYVLGRGNDSRAGISSHPLIVELDPIGQVIGSFLDASNFKKGPDAIEDFGPAEEQVYASIALLNGKLYIYAPSERQVVICSLDGKILSRNGLEDVANKIAHADNVNRAAISEVGFVDENHVVLYLAEYIAPQALGVLDYSNMRTAVYLVDLTAKQFKLILRGEPGLNPGFVGVKDGQLLTITRGPQDYEFHRTDLY